MCIAPIAPRKSWEIILPPTQAGRLVLEVYCAYRAQEELG
jgi:hypothetical protein